MSVGQYGRVDESTDETTDETFSSITYLYVTFRKELNSTILTYKIVISLNIYGKSWCVSDIIFFHRANQQPQV